MAKQPESCVACGDDTSALTLTRVQVTADSDYVGSPAGSTPIEYTVEVSGEGSGVCRMIAKEGGSC